VDISSALVTHPKPSKLVLPGQRALHHPALPSQSLLGLDSWPGQAWGNTAPAQPPSILPRGVGLVAVGLARPEPALAGGRLHRGHGVEQREELVRVVHVGRRQRLGQRQAVGFYEKMMLAARLRSIRRVWACEGPLFEALTDEESMQAREKSTMPRSPSSSSNRRCSSSHTPARVHSSSLRQAVMPDRPNCLRGSISQGIPLLRTKTMASSAARSSARGRPCFFFGLGAGSNGATRCQKASGTSSRTMPPRVGTVSSGDQPTPYFC